MNATRRLLLSSSSSTKSSSLLLQHQSMILPTRSNWDTLLSASQAVYSILFTPQERNTFVDTIDKNIINPNMLGQLDFGLFMSLALHHDLNSDKSLLKKYNFNAKEFVEGSEIAIQHFNECLYGLDKQIIECIEDEIEKKKNHDCNGNSSSSNNTANEGMSATATATATKTTPNKDDKINNSNNNTIEDPQMIQMAKRLELIESIVDNQMKIKAQSAERDEDSLEYQMKQMLSSQFLNLIEKQFAASVVQCYVNDMLRMDYKVGSGEVIDIALMSARAHEVPPEDEEEEEDNDEQSKNIEKTETMEDVSFTKSKEDDENDPVMAQIEILYTISQTFTRKKIGHDLAESISSTGKRDDNNEEEKEEEHDEEEEHTMETAWVAVFEGWIDEKKEPLRWKLVNNRVAWEYPMTGRSIN